MSTNESARANAAVAALSDKSKMNVDGLMLMSREAAESIAELIGSQEREMSLLQESLENRSKQLTAANMEISSLNVQLSVSRNKARCARNELCLKCGRYHDAHRGACEGCRWYAFVVGKEAEE